MLNVAHWLVLRIVAAVACFCATKSCAIDHRPPYASTTRTCTCSHIIRSYYKLTTFHIWSSLSTRKHVRGCGAARWLLAAACVTFVMSLAHIRGLVRRKVAHTAGARMSALARAFALARMTIWCVLMAMRYAYSRFSRVLCVANGCGWAGWLRWLDGVP